MALSIEAPAKINVVLKVIGRRHDEYHNLFSIMVPIDLCDTIHISRGGKGIHLECKGREIPTDKENLIWRACEEFFSQIGCHPEVSLSVEKKIPVAAGLGGGSSDAASTLVGLNKMYGNPLDQAKLHRIARALGADVPFFLSPCPSVATGIGDVLEAIENWPRFWYVIVTPPIAISTAWAYGNIKLELTQAVDNYIVKLREVQYRDITMFLENDLETVVFSRYPQVAELKKLMLRLGAQGAVMSGSGPSVVGLFMEREKAAQAVDVIVGSKVGEVFLTTLWQKHANRENNPVESGERSSLLKQLVSGV